MPAEDIAKAFVQHYYNTFSTDRDNLINLYHDASIMTWEGELLQGKAAIQQKLQQLPPVRHVTTVLDVQPSTSATAMIIFVQGKLTIEQNAPIQFTQVFQLVSLRPDEFFIHNDVFRLQYG